MRAAGAKVYVLSRHASSLEGLCHIVADVSDEESVAAAIREVHAREGRLDILVNNAGFGISGAAEFTQNADAKHLLDVNLFGMVSATKAALPLMRAQGGGRNSRALRVAAPLAIPFQAWYSVSKAAVNAYTLALFNEVKQFGVSVCAVMPGDICTGFTKARQKSHAGDDVYKGRIARSVAKMEKDEENGMAPRSRRPLPRPRGAEKARQALLRHRAFLQVLRAALAHPPHPPHRLAAGAAVRGGMMFKPSRAGRCMRPVFFSLLIISIDIRYILCYNHDEGGGNRMRKLLIFALLLTLVAMLTGCVDSERCWTLPLEDGFEVWCVKTASGCWCARRARSDTPLSCAT